MTSQRDAHWIWCGDTECDRHVWAWARRRFEWNGAGQGELLINADLRYMVWINGRRIGFGPPKAHPDTVPVDRYDVSAYLKPGENLIAVSVYSLGSVRISSCCPRRGSLFARLRHGDELLVTDSTWKMRADPGYQSESVTRWEVQPPVEIYDARLALGEPWRPGFDDTGWSFARILDGEEPRSLVSRDIPPMAWEVHLPDRLIDSGIARFSKPLADLRLDVLAGEIAGAELRPDRFGAVRFEDGALSNTRLAADARSLSDSEACYAIWDFGRVWAGYPVVTLAGTPGAVVDISYAEHLSGGRVDPSKSSMNYFDRIILAPGEIRHRITWPKSARYVQLHIHGGSAAIDRIEWERSNYPVRRKGSFFSEEPWLNQAVEICLHTVQLCMEDSYMDSPWRERGSWLGDDLLKSQIAYHYFGDYALARRFLLHHALGQLPDGMMRGKHPGNSTSHVSTWTLRYPASVLEYCRDSGDWEFAREIWPTLEKIVDWLGTFRNASGLFQAPPVEVDARTNRYNFIDWAPVDTRGINAAWNAFAYDCLQSIFVLGRKVCPRLEEKLGDWLAALRRAFNEVFWDEARGRFVNGMEGGRQIERWGCHENVLALLYDLAAGERRERVLQALMSGGVFGCFVPSDEDYDVVVPECGKSPTVAIALNRYRWPVGKMVPMGTPYFAGYLLQALCKEGMIEEALEFIETCWGNFSKQGGSTVWETWDMRQSLSHGWSSAPALTAVRTLLGIERVDSFGETYGIFPPDTSCGEVRGRVMTRAGLVQVEKRGKRLMVDLPSGLNFVGGLPITEGGSLWVDGEAVSEPAVVVRGGRRYASVEIPAGRHCLEWNIAGSEPKEKALGGMDSPDGS